MSSKVETKIISDEQIVEANKQLDQAFVLINSDKVPEAVEILSSVVRTYVDKYGELGAQCAPVYFRYGQALLFQAQDAAKNSMVFDVAQKQGISLEDYNEDEDEDYEGESDSEEEECEDEENDDQQNKQEDTEQKNEITNNDDIKMTDNDNQNTTEQPSIQSDNNNNNNINNQTEKETDKTTKSEPSTSTAQEQKESYDDKLKQSQNDEKMDIDKTDDKQTEINQNGDQKIEGDIKEKEQLEKKEGDEKGEQKGDDEGEEEQEDLEKEQLSDVEIGLQLAWENLETARCIYEKYAGDKNKSELAEILLCLGDVSAEREDFQSAIVDYQKSLKFFNSIDQTNNIATIQLPQKDDANQQQEMIIETNTEQQQQKTSENGTDEKISEKQQLQQPLPENGNTTNDKKQNAPEDNTKNAQNQLSERDGTQIVQNVPENDTKNAQNAQNVPESDTKNAQNVPESDTKNAQNVPESDTKNVQYAQNVPDSDAQNAQNAPEKNDTKNAQNQLMGQDGTNVDQTMDEKSKEEDVFLNIQLDEFSLRVMRRRAETYFKLALVLQFSMRYKEGEENIKIALDILNKHHEACKKAMEEGENKEYIKKYLDDLPGTIEDLKNYQEELAALQNGGALAGFKAAIQQAELVAQREQEQGQPSSSKSEEPKQVQDLGVYGRSKKKITPAPLEENQGTTNSENIDNNGSNKRSREENEKTVVDDQSGAVKKLKIDETKNMAIEGN